jgi:hypothetical protein
MRRGMNLLDKFYGSGATEMRRKLCCIDGSNCSHGEAEHK